MANERQETEIKPGDWVECIYSGNNGKYCDQFHSGGLYQITSVHWESGELRFDFASDDRGSTSNGWIAKFFVLHTPPSQMGYEEYEAILADQNAYQALMEG